MDNATEMLNRALDGFGQRVQAITEGQWTGPTTCPPWNVRDLVNHVVWSLRWFPVLVLGAGAEEGDASAFDGDLLGDDPEAAWTDADRAAREAAGQADLGKKIATPYGELTVAEFVGLVT